MTIQRSQIFRFCSVLSGVVALGCGSSGNDVADGGILPDVGCTGSQRFDPATNACVASCNPTGLLHNQPLQVGVLTRHYMLYVPAAYACPSDKAWPLIIDFGGTWTGTEADMGEEFYALPGLLAQADAQGFIVARPRSLSSTEDGTVPVYRWDENPGDYGLNEAFGHALVEHIESLYDIDSTRVYAFGFSSGTGMAAQFLADDPQVFHGYGYVGGGYFPGEAPPRVTLPATPPRMYAVSGYRDYLRDDEQALIDLLGQSSYPMASFFRRGSDNGHELYGWHYREMFDWVDGGSKPGPGALMNGWVAEESGTTADLTEMAADGAGIIVAVGEGGTILRRDTTGVWTQVAALGTTNIPGLSGVCLAGGVGFAVGDGVAARSDDDGMTWATTKIPSFDPSYFDPPFHNTVACSDTNFVAMGYWDSAYSGDQGSTWQGIGALESNGDYAAQTAEVKVSASGTWVASGYYYVGRSTDGKSFTGISPPTDAQWFMGIAALPDATWWIAGEAGTLIQSTDDGVDWTAQPVPTVEDLYAISFFDGERGAAVGSHGAVVLTTDGGVTWQDVSTGLDGYLGDVAWLDAHTLLVVGGSGTVLRLAVP